MRYHVPVSKINDQEMVSDMYMDGRFGIKLDHRNEIFQAMHATYKFPLERCDPWPELQNRGGVWEVRVRRGLI
jgi:hypothetical protein